MGCHVRDRPLLWSWGLRGSCRGAVFEANLEAGKAENVCDVWGWQAMDPMYHTTQRTVSMTVGRQQEALSARPFIHSADMN